MSTVGSHETVRALLSGPLAAVLDDAEEGPFADNAAFLLTYEALTSLQVAVHKLAAECQQRVISFASRDFADATAVGVTRAIETLPTVKEWVAKLQTRIEKRGSMPLVDTGLPPRFVRTCDVYELSPVDRKLVGALLMMRTTHAFNSVKMSSSMGYGGGSSLYGNNSKAAVTLAGILDVSMSDLASFQKTERRHVKQGVVLPGSQLLTAGAPTPITVVTVAHQRNRRQPRPKLASSFKGIASTGPLWRRANATASAASRRLQQTYELAYASQNATTLQMSVTSERARAPSITDSPPHRGTSARTVPLSM
jgi:hypothetical protein